MSTPTRLQIRNSSSSQSLSAFPTIAYDICLKYCSCRRVSCKSLQVAWHLIQALFGHYLVFIVMPNIIWSHWYCLSPCVNSKIHQIEMRRTLGPSKIHTHKILFSCGSRVFAPELGDWKLSQGNGTQQVNVTDCSLECRAFTSFFLLHISKCVLTFTRINHCSGTRERRT